jgi:hypothetical protein
MSVFDKKLPWKRFKNRKTTYETPYYTMFGAVEEEKTHLRIPLIIRGRRGMSVIVRYFFMVLKIDYARWTLRKKALRNNNVDNGLTIY